MTYENAAVTWNGIHQGVIVSLFPSPYGHAKESLSLSVLCLRAKDDASVTSSVLYSILFYLITCSAWNFRLQCNSSSIMNCNVQG